MTPEVHPLDFLLEIGCEEIPARMVSGAAIDLAQRVCGILDDARLAYGETRTFATPRRLAVTVRGIDPKQADREEQVTGPPVQAAFAPDGAPTRAALGFAQKMGVEVASLTKIPTAKGEYLGLRRLVPGRPASEILSDGIPLAVAGMTFPKMMRWGDGTRRFVRPIHWLVALLGGEVVPCELFGVRTGRETAGHRILGARRVRIASPSEYESTLLGQGVVVDREQRRRAIFEKFVELAAGSSLQLLEDAALLEEVTDLVEHPGTVMGSFPREFLTLPREVLITTLRHHQKSFSTEAAHAISNHFLVVADIDKDLEGHIRKGNEWVIVGRLEDARFFFHEDRKIPLAGRRQKLEHVTFHAKAGSYAEKSLRVEEIGTALARTVNSAWASVGGEARRIDIETLREASALAKCDLTSGLVGEFPELQGIAGGLYVHAETEAGAASYRSGVGEAIYDQYRPAGPEDHLPRTLEGVVLALSDRLDTLAVLARCVGLPTGSRDPFGLRRAAYAAIRLVAETPLPLSLWQMVAESSAASKLGVERGSDGVGEGEILVFLLERLQFWMKEKNARYDTINAVLRATRKASPAPEELPSVVALLETGERAPIETVPRLVEKVGALERMREMPDFAALAEIHKRCRNILQQAGAIGPPEILGSGVKHDQEEAAAYGSLAAHVTDAERAVVLLMQQDDFEGALQRLVLLRPSLSRFFDHVLVMHPDPDTRTARLDLVRRTAVMIEEVADLKQISISREELQRLLTQLRAG